MSAFSKLENKIRKKEPGLSESSARKITAKIGRDKLGSHEMAERAAKSREAHKESKMEACKYARRSDGSYCPQTYIGKSGGPEGRRYGPDSNAQAGKLPHTFKSGSGE